MLSLNDLVPNIYYIRLPQLNLRLPGCQPPRMFQLILHLLRGPLRWRESLIPRKRRPPSPAPSAEPWQEAPDDEESWPHGLDAPPSCLARLAESAGHRPARNRDPMAPTRVPGVYVFLMVENSTRRIVHFNVTAHPTMEWTSRQLVEAFPWNSAPTCILRDRDSIYGRVFTAMVEATGIEDVPAAPRSPWQNPYYREADRYGMEELPGPRDRAQ